MAIFDKEAQIKSLKETIKETSESLEAMEMHKEQYRKCFDELCAKEQELRRSEEQMEAMQINQEMAVLELKELVQMSKNENKRKSDALIETAQKLQSVDTELMLLR